MPSRSQGLPTQAPSSSSRDMDYLQEHNDMGLATYSHDRDHHLATRSFLFRDEHVRSIGFSRSHPTERNQDCQSNCTSFDDLGNVQSPDHIAHCYTNTNIDDSARVFNGDVARAYDSSSTREHHLHGGSVKNKSKLVNGDLDRDTFLAFFCNSEEETRGAAARRRRGPRAEGRPSPQSRV